MLGAPWYVLCVGFVIVLLILGVSMMGDGMGKGEI
jgi:ABC-type dipeptide/oligopeptide/nickel transport system permease subunit